MHIADPIEKKWFRERMEKKENQLNFTTSGKKFILNKLIQAEEFEKFLAVKFVWYQKVWYKWRRSTNSSFRANNKARWSVRC